jgi:protocatechuate 3,4-dioxygenase beta subunit
MKKVLIAMAAAMLVASAIQAQMPQGAITGRILDDSTNHGILWASVTATKITGDPFEKTVHSLWGGHYGIYRLPPGSYVVSATKPGWSTGEYPDTLVVNDDLHQDIDIYLTEIPIDFGSIAGVITDASTSLPLEGAHVVVRGPGFWNVHSAETGADGAYLVDQLSPGDYEVKAHKMDYFPAEYPDLVAIDGNDTTGIDLALSPVVPTGIRGTVTDISSGNPIEGALVYAMDVNSWFHHRIAITDANGDYEIDARPGEYHVRAWAEGYFVEEYPTNVIVPETGYVEDIDFALSGFNFGSISGTVTDTSGAPLENARITARKYGDFFGRSATSDATGAYTIENLLPGDYRIHAHKRGFEPAEYPDTVTVPDGANVPNIDFALVPFGPDDGVISGTVTDDSTGMPIEGASLIALGRGPDFWNMFVFRREFTDENGDYSFENLPHIPFKIFTYANGYVGEFYDDVGSYFDATPVTPDANDIDVGLAPRENPGILSIYGQILDQEARSLDGVVYLMSEGQIVNIAGTDMDGYYGFSDLNPGTYEVSAFTPYGEGFLNDPIELTFNNYGDADIVIAVTSTDDNSDLLPVKASLSQNYPNPFNAYTSISFELPSATNVELTIYNVVGRRIATLQNGFLNSGEHSVIWDGRNDSGAEVASGIYFYRLSTDNLTETRRMTFLK